MEGEQTGTVPFLTELESHTLIAFKIEDVWGVVDVLVDTDLPDYRFKCIIQATSGAIIVSQPLVHNR